MRSTVKETTRAATPLFRRLAGPSDRFTGERMLRPESRGLNRLEFAVLSVVMPAVLGVAVFDGLWRVGGPWVAGLLVAPVFWLLLHVLVFALGSAKAAKGFWMWAVGLGWWSGWQVMAGGGWVRWIAWAWLGFIGLQGVVGLVGSIWRSVMALKGWPGVVARVLVLVVAHALALAVCWKLGLGWGLPALLVTGLVWVWGTLSPYSQLFGPVVRRVDGGGVLITVDDGPDPVDTERLLDLLDAHGRKAVFFVIGEKVRQHPDLAREILRRGHELGNHTMTHPQASMWCAGPWRTRREILDCQRAIEEVTGTKPRWFRAPVGHRNYFTHPFAAEAGLEVVAWSKRGFDAVERDVGKIVPMICDGAGDGDILLLHESTPVAEEVMKGVLDRIGPAGPGGRHAGNRRDSSAE